MGLPARMSWLLAMATVAVSLDSCGGGGGGGGDGGGVTSVEGSIVLPGQSQCTACSNSDISVGVFALPTNLQNPIATVTTSENGTFDTGDLTEELLLVDPGSDRKTYVVVGVVGTNARIGGVISQRLGTEESKDFNVTTQIACVAAVVLTNTSTECVIPEERITPPSNLDDRRINNLEEAASVVSDQVNLESSSDVNCAVCSTIQCTEEGDLDVNDAVRSCVSTRYTTCRVPG